MSDRKIGTYSSGLWRLRGRVAQMTGMTPVKAALRPWAVGLLFAYNVRDRR